MAGLKSTVNSHGETEQQFLARNATALGYTESKGVPNNGAGYLRNVIASYVGTWGYPFSYINPWYWGSPSERDAAQDRERARLDVDTAGDSARCADGWVSADTLERVIGAVLAGVQHADTGLREREPATVGTRYQGTVDPTPGEHINGDDYLNDCPHHDGRCFVGTTGTHWRVTLATAGNG